MNKSKNKFTLKIVFSYFILAVLAAVVGYFIYSEIKTYVSTETASENDQKLLKTNTLLTSLYKAESLSKLSTQRNTKADFEAYKFKIDSVQNEIETLKKLTKSDFQKGLLDSLQILLSQKVANNKALGELKVKNYESRYIDKALKEFEKIEESIGKFSAENLFPNFEKLSPNLQKNLRAYAALLSKNTPVNPDGSTNVKYIDSILEVSKNMLQEAKLKDFQSQRSLAQKEIEVSRSDLELSQQLQNIIAAFEQEVMTKTLENNLKKQAALRKSTRIAGFSALLGFVIVGLFSFLITRDYWKVQTYRLKLEKEKKYSESLLKSREQLISTVSHDLRTPLNTITGYTELMEGTELSQKQIRYLSNVKSASDYVGNLVNDLLDFSKLEGGKLNIEKIPFIPANLIQDTAESIQAIHKNKNLQLFLEIDAQLHNTFEGDPFRIRQVLTNLIGNAFKFTDTGHIKIKASANKGKQKTQNFIVEIEDTGVGIAKEKQLLVFNEFTQADSTTEKKFGGYGLGLTISKKLTELLGGKLDLESALEKGSTFTLQVPLALAIKQQIDTTPRYLNPKLKILIIDDDTALLGMLAELSESMGMTSNTFTNFLQVPKDSHLGYDLVLTDIQMPQITGFEVLEKLKSGNYKHYKNQPIIAMTGRRDLDSEAYMGIGFDQVLQKPFAKKELIAMLKLLGFQTEKDVPKTTAIEPTVVVSNQPENYSLDIIHSFLGTNEDAVFDVLNTFLRDTKTNLVLLDEGVHTIDYDQINQVAHRMLPMFRQLKATAIVPTLERLEAAKPQLMNKGKLLDALFFINRKVTVLTNEMKGNLTISPSYSD